MESNIIPVPAMSGAAWEQDYSCPITLPPPPIALPPYLPPPHPPTQDQRGGGGSRPVDPADKEVRGRDWRGRGDQPGRRGRRGSSTRAEEELVVRKTFRRVDGAIPT